MKKRSTNLRREIRSFGKTKVFFAIPLLALGILGLILPILPGALFLFAGIILILPSLENKIKKWLGKNI